MSKLLKYRFLSAALLLPLLPAHACRYTVREIGYTDLAEGPYRLYLVLDREATAEERAEFEAVSRALLLNSNIEASLIMRAQADSSVGTWLEASGASLPAGALVSPDGRWLTMSPGEGKGFRAIIWSLLEQAAGSLVRERIRQELVRSFAVILILEGDERASGTIPEQAAASAVKRFSGMRELLPKEVREGIPVITIPVNRKEAESVLLWSLGMDSRSRAPQAAVLYGRARRMGPVISGPDITQETLLNLLSVVGADCECGLDQSWKLGPMAPLKWGFREQEELAAMLGFDVEHPRVKAEMSRIIGFRAAPGRPADPLRTNILESAAEDTSRETIHHIEDNALFLTRITRKVAAGGVALVLGAAALIYIIRKRKTSL
ncbi:hypothetical protein JXO52_13550 [bacterium]|nr:hypothetical protein [bacterium]